MEEHNWTKRQKKHHKHSEQEYMTPDEKLTKIEQLYMDKYYEHTDPN